MWSRYTDEERKAIEDSHDRTNAIFSGSKIEPLNLDLVSLPIANNSIDSDGIISDGRTISIRLKYGWLTVWVGPAGVDNIFEMEIVREVYVGFRGRLHPEQACDILGLTVCGQKVVLSNEVLKNADWDFSGRTTYLRTKHDAFVDEADQFVKLLMNTYSDACLLRDYHGLQPVTQLIEDQNGLSTKYVLGIGRYEISSNKTLPVSRTEVAEMFEHCINISIRRRFDLGNLQKYIAKECQGKDLVDYELIHHMSFSIGMDTKTDSIAGLAVLTNLQALMDGYFCKGAESIDLLAPHNLRSKDENRSYSAKLREWCLFKPNRYLDIQIFQDSTAGKTILKAWRPVA